MAFPADSLGVVRSIRRAFVALAALSILFAAAPASAAEYPTFVNGAYQDTGGVPYDRNTPAVNNSSTPLRGGTFVFPISGSVNYWNTFGQCRGSSCSRPHLGVDMMGSKGTPVVAVDSGTVVWVSSTCCSLAIRHDDGWTSYYIHLNNDTPGTDDGNGQGIVAGIGYGSRVSAGQHIGWLGDSGNAEYSGAHVHFEFQDPNGVWHNPTTYVSSASPAPKGLPGVPGAPAATTTTAAPTTTAPNATTTTVAPATTTPPTTAPKAPTTTTAPVTTAPPTTVGRTTPSTTTIPEATSTTVAATVSTILLELTDDGLLVLTEADLEADIPGKIADVAVFGYVGPDDTLPTTTTEETTTTLDLPESSLPLEEMVEPDPDDPGIDGHGHVHAELGSVAIEPWREWAYDAAASVGAWLADLGA